VRHFPIALLIGLISVTGFAQAPFVEFEVASIKRSSSPPPGSFRTLPTGELIAANTPIRVVFSQAYDFDQIEGVPSWGSDAYDVHVKPPEGATRDQVRAMWRALLMSRMKFVSHYEPRDVPAYKLVMARTDGKLGPELKPAVIDCAAAGAPSGATLAAIRDQPLMLREEGLKHCGPLGAPGVVASGSVLMEEFAFALGSRAGRPVSDGTGLAGRYSVALTYSTPPSPGSDQPPGGTPGAPEIFTALREQLGLKLDSSTKTNQVLVIDHIERPTEN
jgi:uncharacterized protein (TIGR03435 family)